MRFPGPHSGLGGAGRRRTAVGWTTLGSDFFVVDVTISRLITKSAEVFLAVENLSDGTIEVAKTTDGVVTTGTPRLVHGGLQIRF